MGHYTVHTQVNEPFETRELEDFWPLEVTSQPRLAAPCLEIRISEYKNLVEMKLLVFVLFLASLLAQNGGQTVDVGRAKAKISAEEMLKLHRKRREDDKLFSINSPRRSDNDQE